MIADPEFWLLLVTTGVLFCLCVHNWLRDRTRDPLEEAKREVQKLTVELMEERIAHAKAEEKLAQREGPYR